MFYANSMVGIPLSQWTYHHTVSAFSSFYIKNYSGNYAKRPILNANVEI
jgi:hypothetical protein